MKKIDKLNQVITDLKKLKAKEKKEWSLKCSYYDKSFNTQNELIRDVTESGMDPNYEITFKGKGTGERAIDLIQA